MLAGIMQYIAEPEPLHLSTQTEALKRHPDVTASCGRIDFDNFGNRDTLFETKFLRSINLMTASLCMSSASVFQPDVRYTARNTDLDSSSSTTSSHCNPSASELISFCCSRGGLLGGSSITLFKSIACICVCVSMMAECVIDDC